VHDPQVVKPWSASADEPRARRPTDLVLLVVCVVALGVAVEVQPGGGSNGRGISAVLVGWTFLRHAWWTLTVLSAVAAIVLVVGALLFRRWRLLRDVLVAALFAGLVMVALHHLFPVPGSALAPILRLSLVAAVVSVFAPHLVRPLRYAGHGVVIVLSVSTIALGDTNLDGVVVALLVAGAAAAGAHLVFGSPGGRPSVERVRQSLHDLDAGVDDVRAAPLRPDGVAQFVGTATTGPVTIKVFGRDAWNGQLVAAVWRWLTMRGPGAHLAVTRVQQAEHEALMAHVAQRHGVAVPTPELVAKAASGDVVLVAAAPPATGLGAPSAATLEATWTLLDHLHDAGVVHRSISGDELALGDDGAPMFVALDHAVLASDDRSRRTDRAQLLATTAVLAGTEPAIDAFLARHRDDAAPMLRYLQPAVLTKELDGEVTAAEVDLTAMRTAIAERCDVREPELEKVRRITRGAVVTTMLLGLAAFFVVSAFSDLDFAEVRHALQDANWWWLIFAFLIAQSTRLGGGFSMLGACRTPLPAGPVFLLQFSFPFIDVAAPAAAGRIAATMRFQQKYGVPPTAALSASIIDSGAGFAAQIILMAITFSVTDLSLGQLGGDSFDIDLRLLLIIAIVVAAIVSLVLVIPMVRRRIMGHVREIWSALGVLKSPSKFALLLGGSALTELLCAVTMGLCLHAFGLTAPFSALLVVTAFIRFVSGISPIPGGLGIAEAGLTGGLVAIGVPVELAFPATMIYRLVTFYVPPAYGWFVLGLLRKKQYL